MANVEFALAAQTDLLEAWIFIAENNPGAADHVLDTIEHEAHILATQPRMGRARPELCEGVRSWPTSVQHFVLPGHAAWHCRAACFAPCA